MVKPAICRLTEASVLVDGRVGVPLGNGAIVDLAQVLIPSHEEGVGADRHVVPDYTLEQALVGLVERFELIQPPTALEGVRVEPSAAGEFAAAAEEQE